MQLLPAALLYIRPLLEKSGKDATMLIRLATLYHFSTAFSSTSEPLFENDLRLFEESMNLLLPHYLMKLAGTGEPKMFNGTKFHQITVRPHVFF